MYVSAVLEIVTLGMCLLVDIMHFGAIKKCIY